MAVRGQIASENLEVGDEEVIRTALTDFLLNPVEKTKAGRKRLMADGASYWVGVFRSTRKKTLNCLIEIDSPAEDLLYARAIGATPLGAFESALDCIRELLEKESEGMHENN